MRLEVFISSDTNLIGYYGSTWYVIDFRKMPNSIRTIIKQICQWSLAFLAETLYKISPFWSKYCKIFLARYYIIFMIDSIVAAGITCYISENSIKFSKLLSNKKFKNYKMIDGKRYLLELLPSFRVIQQKHNGLLLGFTKCLKH